MSSGVGESTGLGASVGIADGLGETVGEAEIDALGSTGISGVGLMVDDGHEGSGEAVPDPEELEAPSEGAGAQGSDGASVGDALGDTITSGITVVARGGVPCTSSDDADVHISVKAAASPATNRIRTVTQTIGRDGDLPCVTIATSSVTL